MRDLAARGETGLELRRVGDRDLDEDEVLDRRPWQYALQAHSGRPTRRDAAAGGGPSEPAGASRLASLLESPREASLQHATLKECSASP
ncbi:hypothetical protein [Streptomyces diastaticus]